MGSTRAWGCIKTWLTCTDCKGIPLQDVLFFSFVDRNERCDNNASQVGQNISGENSSLKQVTMWKPLEVDSRWAREWAMCRIKCSDGGGVAAVFWYISGCTQVWRYKNCPRALCSCQVVSNYKQMLLAIHYLPYLTLPSYMIHLAVFLLLAYVHFLSALLLLALASMSLFFIVFIVIFSLVWRFSDFPLQCSPLFLSRSHSLVLPFSVSCCSNKYDEWGYLCLSEKWSAITKPLIFDSFNDTSWWIDVQSFLLHEDLQLSENRHRPISRLQSVSRHTRYWKHSLVKTFHHLDVHFFVFKQCFNSLLFYVSILQMHYVVPSNKTKRSCLSCKHYFYFKGCHHGFPLCLYLHHPPYLQQVHVLGWERQRYNMKLWVLCSISALGTSHPVLSGCGYSIMA